MSTEGIHAPDDLLTISEAAATLRVSYSTLRRWEKVGRIEVERTPGNQRRYRRRALDAVLQPVAEREAS
jgi:excisionase family DNA binding protein